jgi:hypothetical protein
MLKPTLRKVTNWVAINVSGLIVQRVSGIYTSGIDPARQPGVASYGIWLHPSTGPLSVAGRFLDSGTTMFA